MLQLAPLANGRIALQYRRVTCTPQEPVKVRVDANRGSGGWMRLWVMVSPSICLNPFSAVQQARPASCIDAFVGHGEPRTLHEISLSRATCQACILHGILGCPSICLIPVSAVAFVLAP